ncbi:MAG: hypothetical protein WC982_09765 [Advenella sp.]
MADLGELRAKISAEIDEFERGLDSASKKADGFGKTTEKAGRDGAKGLQASDRAMRALSVASKAAAAAVAAAAAAMVTATARAMTAADEHAKLARAMGITNTELAVLKRAADLSGVSIGELESNTRRMARALTEAADGTGASAEAFEKLGLNAEDIIDLDMEEQLVALGDAFEGVTNRSERAAIAQDIFGRSGMGMLNVLEDARGTFARANDEVERFGLALSETESRQIEAANDAISTLKAAMGSFATQMAAQVAPSVQTVADKLTGFVEGLIESRRESKAFIDFQKGITDETATAAERLEALTDARAGAERRLDASLKGRGVLAIAIREEIAAIDEEIAAQERAVEARRQADNYVQTLQARGQAVTEENKRQLEEEAEAREAAAERAAYRQGRLNEAYAATLDGQIAATEASIAFFKTFEPQGPKATAILEQLNEQLEQLNELKSGGGEEDDGGVPEQDYTDQIARLEEFLMSEEEAIQASHERRVAIAMEAIEDENERRAMIEQLESKHQDNLTEIHRRAQQQRIQMAMQTGGSIANNLISAYQNMGEATTKNEKKLFENRKRAAISQALVNTALGITGALSSGKPWAWMEATAFAAAGAAQVAAIRAQKFNGGGSSTAPSPASPSTSTSDGGGGGPSRSLLIQGDFDSNSLFTGEAVRSLMDRIAEAQEDGYTVVMS